MAGEDRGLGSECEMKEKRQQVYCFPISLVLKEGDYTSAARQTHG